MAYEAGPTGFHLARALEGEGIECVVAAPSKLLRASGDRIKTDRRDALHLAEMLVAGQAVGVRVPTAEEESAPPVPVVVGRPRRTVQVSGLRPRN
ncbi:MAG: hypothetical protein ACTJGR_03980 [Pauljensenia sp.]